MLNASRQVSIPIPSQGDEWIGAEILRDQFVTERNANDTIDTAAEIGTETQASVELFALFLRFIAKKLDAEPQSFAARTALLLDTLKHFTSTHLAEQDIHHVSASFDADVRKTVLAAYYFAVATLEEKQISAPRAPASALLHAAEQGEAGIYALFGGQGTNEVYMDELQGLYDTYTPYVEPFVADMVNIVLVPLAAKWESTNYYGYGLDVLSWLSSASARPPVPYLASIPVSYPLIALTQLVQYLIVCRVANLTPGELRSRLAGTTGHSQGLGSAIAIAASDSFESFSENSAKMLKWSFSSSLRGQELFPVLALEPSIVADAIEGGEGIPSPMLSVTGLQLKDLEAHVTKANAHLPENSKLQVSLHNAQKVFVVAGPPRALYGLVTNLRKVKAPVGLDQSKTPFSQRKLVFNMRFLVVNVPFHSHYLQGATKKLVEEDFGGEELWTPQDLAIPVYNTEDGEHFRSLMHLTCIDITLSRLGSQEHLRLLDGRALRPYLHENRPLDEGNRLPGDRDSRDRFRSRWSQRLWSHERSQP